jgi:hypothetical protein
MGYPAILDDLPIETAVFFRGFPRAFPRPVGPRPQHFAAQDPFDGGHVTEAEALGFRDVVNMAMDQYL